MGWYISNGSTILLEPAMPPTYIMCYQWCDLHLTNIICCLRHGLPIQRQIFNPKIEEIIMLRFPMGVTRKDKIRNEHIGDTLKVDGLERRLDSPDRYGKVM